MSTTKLSVNYLVIECSAPAGPVSLGILGTVKLTPESALLFFVANSPKSIKGLDPFEMKLVSATPNAISDDLSRLTSQNVPPDKLLDEVSRRYRGTIFASQRTPKEIPATTMPKITDAIMHLAQQEKVGPSPPSPSPMKRKSRRRVAKKATSNRRRLDFPQQFELTTLHI